MKAYLVVTADDVGLHPGMTDGAIDAHDHGIVTACSVVAGGSDLERAAALLRARPGLDVGVHVVLAGGPLVSAPEEVPSLVPRGLPIPGYAGFIARLATRRIDLADVERETRAQIRRLRDAGLDPAHIDGHRHLHVAPGVIGTIVEVARAEGIGYVRIPHEPILPFGVRRASIWVLGMLARRAREIARGAGLATNDRAAGIAAAGKLGAARLTAALASMSGVTELVVHPGAGNARIAAAFAWGFDWDQERLGLTAPAVREAVERRGIHLIGTREVVRLRAAR
jgi:predicted glycoside hydrolase/deacetylase ChbG (UPF0249 family)